MLYRAITAACAASTVFDDAEEGEYVAADDSEAGKEKDVSIDAEQSSVVHSVLQWCAHVLKI